MFVAFAQPAQAFFDPPYITPSQPVAGKPISVNVRGGVCDGIIGLPGYPEITQEGGAVTILFFGVRETNPEFCYYPVGEAEFPIGSYPAGSYTLEVDLRYINGFGSFVVDTIGIVPFTVTGQMPPPMAAAPVPTLSVTGLGILLIALASLAGRTLSARRAHT